MSSTASRRATPRPLHDQFARRPTCLARTRKRANQRKGRGRSRAGRRRRRPEEHDEGSPGERSSGSGRKVAPVACAFTHRHASPSAARNNPFRRLAATRRVIASATIRLPGVPIVAVAENRIRAQICLRSTERGCGERVRTLRAAGRLLRQVCWSRDRGFAGPIAPSVWSPGPRRYGCAALRWPPRSPQPRS